MRKLFFILTTLAGIALTLSAVDNRFVDLNDAQKLDLSEAYQAVGEHFTANGEEKRGADYEETARILRDQIADLSQAAAAKQSVPTAMPAPPEPEGVTENDEKAVGYYFKKLIRALLSENADGVMALLDDPFALEGYLSGVPREKIEQDLALVFDTYNLTDYDSTDLYRMDRISYVYDKSTKDVVILTVPAAVSGEGSSLEMVIFWKDIQKFYFKRAERGWRLFAIF